MLAMTEECSRSWEPTRSPALVAASRRPRVLPPTSYTYTRRRIVAALVLTAMVLLAWAAVREVGVIATLSSPGRSSAGAPMSGSAYVVQPGETLWSIARRVDPGGDPRPVVDRLAAAHGGAELTAGEVIILPR
ncbi:MAG TPA: LysM peptidoglycan-binding domain-containing protein [Acidimicrobiales bacterium]|jgi:nucleoid-associated protein YgaU